MSKEFGLGLEMKISRRVLRVLLLHEFLLSRKATEAASNICSTMGKDVWGVDDISEKRDIVPFQAEMIS